MNPIRVLIADDHALFREGLQALLMTVSDIECVGEAINVVDTIEKVEALQPDIVLMDISMPDGDGIEATRRLFQINPNIGVVMVTMLEDEAFLFAAMCAGARGYVLKGANHKELLQTIRAVSEGQALFGAAVSSRILSFFRSIQSESKMADTGDLFAELTARELDILELVAQGLNNNEIAELLVISSRTVRNHLTSIFRKLQVNNRSQVIVQARVAGLGQEDLAFRPKQHDNARNLPRRQS